MPKSAGRLSAVVDSAIPSVAIAAVPSHPVRDDQSKLHLVQVCRGIAALLVLLFHDAITYFPLYEGTYDRGRPGGPTPFDFGHAGVDFFFVLSGFIILWAHWSDIGRPQRLGRYVWRRVVRIYPTLWIALALILPVYFLRPALGGGYERDLDVILRSAVLWPQAHLPIIPPAWSLCHEMMFYGLFALAIINLRAGIFAFATWFGAIVAVAVFGGEFPLSFIGHPHNLQFFMGLAAALYLHRRRAPAPWLIAALGTLLFIGTGMLETYYPEPARLGLSYLGLGAKLAYGCGSMLVIVGLVEIERSRRIAVPAALLLLGDASYSIYLLHNALLATGSRMLRSIGLNAIVAGWPAFVMLAAIAVAGGVLFHLLLERPVLRYLRRAPEHGLPLGLRRRATTP